MSEGRIVFSVHRPSIFLICNVKQMCHFPSTNNSLCHASYRMVVECWSDYKAFIVSKEISVDEIVALVLTSFF